MNVRDKILEIVTENPTLSAREIGKQVGLHRVTVNWHLRKLGIPRNRLLLQSCNNTKRSYNINISENAEQIILGSILGDGYISKWRRDSNSHLNLNSALKIIHTSPQKEYLIYLKELLEKEGIKCQKILVVDKNTIKNKYKTSINGRELTTINDSYRLSTRRAITFNKYRDMFYKKVKYINRYIYKLKPLGLAIWYMDDGYKHDKTYYFCTDCFSIKDIKLLQNVLKHNFNLDTTIDSKNRIRIRTSSAKQFKELVLPYIHKNMLYKLH